MNLPALLSLRQREHRFSMQDLARLDTLHCQDRLQIEKTLSLGRISKVVEVVVLVVVLVVTE